MHRSRSALPHTPEGIMPVDEACRIADVPRGTLSEVARELASRPYARRGVPARSEPIRVVLIDDHALVRAGLRSLLHSSTGISVVGEGGDGRDAVALALRTRPDVLVMDLDMPTVDGITATRQLHGAAPEVRVLIVSMHSEQDRLLAVLDAGARGYLAKSAADRELVDAIRVVAAGDVYVRPAVAAALAMADREPPVERLDARARLERLSHREQTVVTLTARGFNGPEIGRQLGIAAKTVDTYKQRIEEKLGLAHRSEYVRLALQADLLDTGPR